MKRAWRANEAVSPVIATILMVAITVVLAAVLYVMVMGIRPPDTKVSAGTVQSVNTRGNSVEIVFGSFTGTPRPTEVTILLEPSSGAPVSLSWSGEPTNRTTQMVSDTPDVTAVYKDYQPQGNEVNQGDSIVVDGLQAAKRYYVKLMNNDDGSVIELGGDSDFILTVAP